MPAGEPDEYGNGTDSAAFASDLLARSQAADPQELESASALLLSTLSLEDDMQSVLLGGGASGLGGAGISGFDSGSSVDDDVDVGEEEVDEEEGELELGGSSEDDLAAFGVAAGASPAAAANQRRPAAAAPASAAGGSGAGGGADQRRRQQQQGGEGAQPGAGLAADPLDDLLGPDAFID